MRCRGERSSWEQLAGPNGLAAVENHIELTGKCKVTLDACLVVERVQPLKPGDRVGSGPDDSDAVERMSAMLAPVGLKLERRTAIAL